MLNSVARILVVDDDPYVRLFVVQALQRDPSYMLTEASSKAEALALHQAHAFDLILSDLRMEQIDAGIDLLQIVKRQSPETKVILLTAYATLDTAIASVRSHADDYLLKPVSISSLNASVTNALADYRQRQTERVVLQQITALVENLNPNPDTNPAGMTIAHKDNSANQYLTCGLITIDTHHYEALIADAPVELTATEFALVRTLVLAHGRTVTFEDLVSDVYQQYLDRESARSLLASHVRNLRRKLGLAASQLVNVRGIGYYLTDIVSDELPTD